MGVGGGWLCVGSVCVCGFCVVLHIFLFIFFFGKYLRKRIFFNKTKNKNLFLFIFDRAKIKRVNTTGCLL